MKEWLRLKEAQDYCGVSKRTIQNWIKYEGLKYSKVRGTVLISVKSLDSFLERFSVSNDNEAEIDQIVNEILN